MLKWLTDNWFNIIQTFAIVITLVITCITVKKNAEITKTSNILNITNAYRDIWGHIFDYEKHKRVLDPNLIVEWAEITEEEKRFANIVILHMQACYLNAKNHTTIETDGFDYDLKTTIALPIFKAVWDHNNICYNAEFVKFVKNIMNE